MFKDKKKQERPPHSSLCSPITFQVLTTSWQFLVVTLIRWQETAPNSPLVNLKPTTHEHSTHITDKFNRKALFSSKYQCSYCYTKLLKLIIHHGKVTFNKAHTESPPCSNFDHVMLCAKFCYIKSCYTQSGQYHNVVNVFKSEFKSCSLTTNPLMDTNRTSIQNKSQIPIWSLSIPVSLLPGLSLVLSPLMTSCSAIDEEEADTEAPYGLSWAPSQYKDRLSQVQGFPC